MSVANLISLAVFLWLGAVYLILSFLRAARRYGSDPEEQRREDRAQERSLRALALKNVQRADKKRQRADKKRRRRFKLR